MPSSRSANRNFIDARFAHCRLSRSFSAGVALVPLPLSTSIYFHPYSSLSFSLFRVRKYSLSACRLQCLPLKSFSTNSENVHKTFACDPLPLDNRQGKAIKRHIAQAHMIKHKRAHISLSRPILYHFQVVLTK